MLKIHGQKYCVVGVSLIELLVAMAIGTFLVFGATQMYVDSRNVYEVTETSARLQETARYALNIVEPDIRMSNYWGLVKGASVIIGQAAKSAASAGGPDSCGTNYARDLLINLEGGNNSYGLGCSAYGTGAIVSSDTITVRRASVSTAVPVAGTLQICSTRLQGTLISNGTACTAAPAGQMSNLIVNTYYVDRDSVQRAGLPALRRWTLAAGPVFASQEITPGVEDLQVQFGVDTTGSSGVATRYVNPNALAVLVGAQVVSVRIWLLVRAENPEVGFVDGRRYEYADRSAATCTTTNLNATGSQGCAYAPGDGFRRVLVSRTIQIRNALGT